MPITFNGLGTAVCPARGFVSWDTNKTRQADCDAVECFVVLFLPVVPIEPIHAFCWNRNQYQKVPLRWSIDLVGNHPVCRQDPWASVLSDLFLYVPPTFTSTIRHSTFGWAIRIFRHA